MTGTHSTTDRLDVAEPTFEAQAWLEQALLAGQWQLPAPWREGVLANLDRLHGMISELDALPAEAGGRAKP